MRHRLLPLCLALLAACATLPGHPDLTLADLAVREGDDLRPYLGGVGPLAPPGEDAPTLPLEPAQVHELPTAFAAWADYDMNADGVVDPGEQTVAWLERLFEMRQGRRTSLMTLSGAPVKGLRLPSEDEAQVRAAIAATPDGARLIAGTEAFLSALREHRRATTGILLWPLSR